MVNDEGLIGKEKRKEESQGMTSLLASSLLLYYSFTFFLYIVFCLHIFLLPSLDLPIHNHLFCLSSLLSCLLSLTFNHPSIVDHFLKCSNSLKLPPFPPHPTYLPTSFSSTSFPSPFPRLCFMQWQNEIPIITDGNFCKTM